MNLLPDEGKVEFAEVIQRNPSSPNVEQLEAVLAKYGVTMHRKNVYEFIKSPRAMELTITAGVIRNRLLGATLAAAGADDLHADARRLTTGYWMTVARAAQELDTPKRSDETPEQFEGRRSRAQGEMDLATKNLTNLGALKAGEDKGAIAVAKLELQKAGLKLAKQKFQRMTIDAVRKAASDPAIQAILAGAGNNDQKTEALGRALFGEDWDA